jgi:hypothetical protein
MPRPIILVKRIIIVRQVVRVIYSQIVWIIR